MCIISNTLILSVIPIPLKNMFTNPLTIPEQLTEIKTVLKFCFLQKAFIFANFGLHRGSCVSQVQPSLAKVLSQVEDWPGSTTSGKRALFKPKSNSL